jgi:hypothetical protein
MRQLLQTILKSPEEGDYILVSSVHNPVMGLDETMSFACDENGKVTDWSELDVIRPNNHYQMLNDYCALGYHLFNHI